MLTLAGCLQSLWAVDVTVTMNNVSKTMSLVNKTTSAPVEVGEPVSNKYTFSCDEGTYVLTAYATDGTTVNGTIELNVSGDAADFSVFTCTYSPARPLPPIANGPMAPTTAATSVYRPRWGSPACSPRV